MLKIIDIDRHVVEPEYMWEKYTDKEIFKAYPIKYIEDNYQQMGERAEKFGPHAAIKLPPEIFIGDSPIVNHLGLKERLASALKSKGIQHKLKAGMSAEAQIESLDTDGIEQAFVLPSFAMYIVNHSDIPANVSLAYANAYNRWLKDYCDYDPKRLNAVGIMSRHEPANLTAQLDKIIDYGWSCITLRPEVIAGKDIGHNEYEDFWLKCEKHNIAIAFHGGTNLYAPTVGTDRFTSRFSLHACSHPMEAQMAFISLLESGVLERHPNLKIAFLESGASWVPHWLWRLDNICYPEFPSLVENNIKMLPSEYFKRQCWVAIELGEPCLRDVIDVIGHKKLLYGTDFPHPDHLHFTTDDIAKQLNELTQQELQDVLHNNANDFYSRTAMVNDKNHTEVVK